MFPNVNHKEWQRIVVDSFKSSSSQCSPKTSSKTVWLSQRTFLTKDVWTLPRLKSRTSSDLKFYYRLYIYTKSINVLLSKGFEWYSRCIVGWEFDTTLDTRMVIKALKKAQSLNYIAPLINFLPIKRTI